MAIYEPDNQTIGAILQECQTNARLLIPNLQRPFVWKPDQVVRLIDSLLRGWPFGTLLIWNCGEILPEDTNIPNRPFWQTVSVNQENFIPIPFLPVVAPARVRMVLDGQQRLQSLLLAFGPENSKFVRRHRDWRDISHGRNEPIGASLYLDIAKLSEMLTDEGIQGALGLGLPRQFNYSEVLIWAYDDGNVDYVDDENLRLRSNTDIRLSRIWNHPTNIAALNNEPDLQINHARNFLSNEHIPQNIIDTCKRAFAQIWIRIIDIRNHPIHYFQLADLANSGYANEQGMPDQAAYNDAIVNIFTRLNSAGETLTKQEITFARINATWEILGNAHGTARDAINEFISIARDYDEELSKSIKTDDIISMLSFIWSAYENNGGMISNNDLLIGNAVNSLSGWLYTSWNMLKLAFTDVVRLLSEKDFSFRDTYRSLNAVTLLVTVQTGVRLLAGVNHNDQLVAEQALSNYSEGWLILSQWAEIWRARTDKTMARYCVTINKAWKCPPKSWTNVINDIIIALRDKSIEYIETLSYDRREEVSKYRNVLWVWIHMNEERKNQLRIMTRHIDRETTLEVDHLVPWSWWRNNESELLTRNIGNQLGDCTLLGKRGNIHKGDRWIDPWLKGLRDAQINAGIREDDTIKPNAWKEAFQIPEIICQAPEVIDECWSNKLVDAINKRNRKIKDDLIKYIDLHTLPTVVHVNITQVDKLPSDENWHQILRAAVTNHLSQDDNTINIKWIREWISKNGVPNNISDASIRDYLRVLIQEGLLVQNGKAKGTYYTIAK